MKKIINLLLGLIYVSNAINCFFESENKPSNEDSYHQRSKIHFQSLTKDVRAITGNNFISVLNLY